MTITALDIQIVRQRDIAIVIPLTIKGKHWIVDNVNLHGKLRYHIPEDSADELVELMKREGLEVEIKC